MPPPDRRHPTTAVGSVLDARVTENQLIDLERRLREAAMTGALVDLAHADDRDVPAELLVDLLIKPLRAGETLRALNLSGARIVGPLDLEAATLLCPLSLDDCQLPSPVTLVNAVAPSLKFTGCTLSSVDATQPRTSGDLDLPGSALTDVIWLIGARIGGQLNLGGVTLSNESGPSLVGDGLQVDGNMACNDSFSTKREIRLPGAHIIGQLILTDAVLSNDSGPSLIGDGLRADGGVFCDGSFSSSGMIRLVSARIAVELSFNGATSSTPPAQCCTATGCGSMAACLAMGRSSRMARYGSSMPE